MSEPREQQEPSMEEILSSIRRIIADEEAEEGQAEERTEAFEAEPEDDDTGTDDDEDVLELTQVVREGGEVVDLNAEETAAQAAAAEAEPDEPAAEAASEPDEAEFAPRPQETGAAPGEETVSQEEPSAVPTKQAVAEELLSNTAATAATGAFAKFSTAIQRTAPEESVAEGSGRTVEQFVEDMIRPMLRSWLDENLPPIVERLVQKEIQKIARRAELLQEP